MSRLPTDGGDSGSWGTILNDYLSSTAGITALASSPSAEDTSFDIAVVPCGLVVGSLLVIDAFTTEVELRRVTKISGNTVSVAALSSSHAAGDKVIVHDGGLVPWTWGGAIANSTTAASTNVTAFNRITNQLYAVSSDFNPGGILVPGGTWYVDDELRPERSQTIQGSGTMASKITATSGFSFPDNETAIIHPYRDGSPVTYATAGPSSRWPLRDIYIDGNNVSGANGILSSPQQPDGWYNVRVSNCPGYGIALVDVQQHVMKNIELVTSGTGLILRNVSFLFCEDIDLEQNTVASIVAESISPGDMCQHNHFVNLHLEESLVPTDAVLIDISSGDGWMFENLWVSNPTDGQTLFKFDVSGGLMGWPIFSLRNIRANAPSADFTMVNDVQRSITRTSLDVYRYIHEVISGGASDQWQMEITGPVLGSGLGDPAPKFLNGIRLSGDLFGGSGAPSDSDGADGDYYFRTDTPATQDQRIYVKSSGAWIPII